MRSHSNRRRPILGLIALISIISRGSSPVGGLMCHTPPTLQWHCEDVRHINELVTSDQLPHGVSDLRISLQPGLSLSLPRADDEEPSPKEAVFASLISLNLAGQPLSLEGSAFEIFPRLRRLNVSSCGLSELKPQHFPRNYGLEQLDASYNDLKELPLMTLDRFAHLKEANFSHNNLAAEGVFPHLCDAAADLLHLDLSYNELNDTSFVGCRKLKTLVLNDNLLQKLSASSFRGLRSLEKLSVAANYINSIEDGTFDDLQQLQGLNLSANSLTTLRYAGQPLTSLRWLDLSRNDLVSLSAEDFRPVPQLQHLDLSENALTTLGPRMWHLMPSLRRLYLHTNDLTSVAGQVFASLAELDTLDLSRNAIASIDTEAFGSAVLGRMRKLLLTGNLLEQLPPLVFSSLPYLEYLSVANNNLTRLDVRLFAGLRRLDKLHLGHNQLEEIGADVLEALDNVSSLLLDFNRLTFMPDVRGDFPRLRRVTLEGNPWQCACLFDMMRWLNAKRVDFVRMRSVYFQGQRPVCVVTPTTACVKNRELVREYRIVEHFEEGVEVKDAASRQPIEKWWGQEVAKALLGCKA